MSSKELRLWVICSLEMAGDLGDISSDKINRFRFRGKMNTTTGEKLKHLYNLYRSRSFNRNDLLQTINQTKWIKWYWLIAVHYFTAVLCSVNIKCAIILSLETSNKDWNISNKLLLL